MKNKPFSISRLALIVALGAIAYLGFEIYLLRGDVAALSSQLAQNKADFATTTSVLLATKQELNQTIAERDSFEQKYSDQFATITQLSSEVFNMQGTVGNLQKLSQTDPHLLEKYSKVYFLNENYIPASLTKIDPQYTYDPKQDYFFLSQAWPFLLSMMQAAQSDGVDIKIVSAYRSFYDQANLNSYYNVVFGSGANSFSAEQGYSEHQLGTAVDFTTESLNGQLSGFDQTPTYQWLLDNAYKFGFVLSYPKDNPYYIYEPWHWRFVGRDLATTLHQKGEYFYDMSQSEINQYLIDLFN